MFIRRCGREAGVVGGGVYTYARSHFARLDGEINIWDLFQYESYNLELKENETAF